MIDALSNLDNLDYCIDQFKRLDGINKYYCFHLDKQAHDVIVNILFKRGVG